MPRSTPATRTGSGARPQPPAGQREGAVVVAHRKQPPPRIAGAGITGPATFGRREPSIGIPAQHRAGPGAVQLPKTARPGRRQLPAQRLIAGQRRITAAAPPRVDLQHARPHITGGDQQPDATPPLSPGQPQPDPGGAIHHPTHVRIPLPRHGHTPPDGYDENPHNTCGHRTSGDRREHPLTPRPGRCRVSRPQESRDIARKRRSLRSVKGLRCPGRGRGGHPASASVSGWAP